MSRITSLFVDASGARTLGPSTCCARVYDGRMCYGPIATANDGAAMSHGTCAVGAAGNSREEGCCAVRERSANRNMADSFRCCSGLIDCSDGSNMGVRCMAPRVGVCHHTVMCLHLTRTCTNVCGRSRSSVCTRGTFGVLGSTCGMFFPGNRLLRRRLRPTFVNIRTENYNTACLSAARCMLAPTTVTLQFRGRRTRIGCGSAVGCLSRLVVSRLTVRTALRKGHFNSLVQFTRHHNRPRFLTGHMTSEGNSRRVSRRLCGGLLSGTA